jgi:hypothetical protein
MRRGDDTGTLVMAMLVIMVGVMLSLVLVPVAVNQLVVTENQTQRNQALAAAETGLDVALGQIRAATDGIGAGVKDYLPCGPMAGDVSSVGTAEYTVTIDYLLDDPQGEDDDWVEAHRLACTPNGGPSAMPAYAVLRAEGTDPVAGARGPLSHRSLRATYTFKTDNRLVSGGQIHAYRTSGGLDLCMDAGTPNPSDGASLRMRLCNPSSTTQKFSYNTNLTLSLVSSRTAAMPLGMCLEAGATHANNNRVTFAPCTTTTVPRQQWSYNGSANFEGTSNGSTLDGYCFNLQSPNQDGSFVTLRNGSGCKQSYNNVQSFLPEKSVGAGAAGKAGGQLVNFDQFGRCLDVTEQKPNHPFLIAWPCKQAPDPNNVDWNQRFTIPAPGVEGRITTTKGTTYCLTSPGSTAPGAYVTLTNCPANLSDSMKWRVFEATDRYDTSYRVLDKFGNCLTVTDPDATPPDLYQTGLQIGKIVVRKCNASTTQKWNATPDLADSAPLTDVIER